MSNLSDLDRIDSHYAKKLEACGISSQETLLQLGGTSAGRKNLARETGISNNLLEMWVNRADLARVHGVGREYVTLLECAGVGTLHALAQQNGTNLHAKLIELNSRRQLVRTLPSESVVIRWIARAKGMDSAVQS